MDHPNIHTFRPELRVTPVSLGVSVAVGVCTVVVGLGVLGRVALGVDRAHRSGEIACYSSAGSIWLPLGTPTPYKTIVLQTKIAKRLFLRFWRPGPPDNARGI